MKNISRFLFAIYFLLSFFVIPAVAEETTIRPYSLPDHGRLHLRTPKSWKDHLRQPPHRFPPTIVFNPTTGKPFEILITPVWPVSSDMPQPNAERIKAQVKQTAEHAKSQAVERDIDVAEIKGTSGIGYYFTATDRAPKPGEYKHMTQGMLLVNDIALAFTILTNDGQDNIITDALTMLKSAVHLADNKT